MEYRMLPHGREKISILGLGMGSIHLSLEEEIERTVTMALDQRPWKNKEELRMGAAGVSYRLYRCGLYPLHR